MKRTATGACIAAVFGLAISASAQQPPPPTAQTPRPMTSDKSSKDLSVTGCLAKSADGMYTLTNAKIDPPGSASASTSTSTTGTTGTSGTTATAPAGSTSATGATWALSGSSSDLDKHVGHKIQVMGKEASPSATGTSGSTTPPASSSMTATQKLDVSSVKMIAASCS